MDHRPDRLPEHLLEGKQLKSCAGFLAVLSLALFGVFAITALATALPLQLLQPDWQLRLSTSLIDNGPIAALALVASWLAVVLSPVPGRYTGQLATVRQWAIAAALGYLLLIPLQGSAAWRGLSQVLNTEAQEQRQAAGQLAALRAVVRSAPTASALEQQWRARSGPRLTAADLAQPLPQLQGQLLAQLQQLDNRLQASRSSGARQARVWAVAQNTLRLSLSALFLALGFAAAAKRKRSPITLLEAWQNIWFGSLQRLRTRHPGRGRRVPGSPEDADYFEAISPKD